MTVKLETRNRAGAQVVIADPAGVSSNLIMADETATARSFRALCGRKTGEGVRP